MTIALLSTLTFADDVTIVARVHSPEEMKDTLHYPVVLDGEGLPEILRKLGPDEDVLLKGQIEYHPVKYEGRTEMNPTFHVEKIIPVSLKKIGKVDFVPVEQKVTFRSPAPYAPGTIGVTGKVATAITLTASILLMKELAGNQETQKLNDQLNTGLIFSAGALATGAFLWEQMKKPELK